MFTKFFTSLVFLICCINYGASAQSFQFSGKVLNSKNEPLQGATILVKEISKQVISNSEGIFSVDLEKGKKYTINVSSTGFTEKSIADIEVSENRDNNFLDIVLKESVKNNLAGVTVTTTSRRQENTNSIIAFQKNNTALSSGLAADFIRRTPDKNTSEVLRRVSGASIQDNKFVIVRGLSDRYNAAFINGAALPSSEPDKKAFSFDVIPSSLIDNIIINKTATPDITGEFAGGIVQIVTKDIPTKNELAIGVSLGFNTQSVFNDFTSNERGKTDFLGYNTDRKLPSAYPRKYNDYAKLSTAEREAVAKSFKDDVYNEVTSTAAPIQQYNLTLSNVKKYNNGSAFGSVVGLTYRSSKLLYNASRDLFQANINDDPIFKYIDNQNKYSVNAGALVNIAWSYKKNKVAFKNLFNQLFEDNYYQRNGPNNDNNQDVQLRSSVLNQRSLYSTQLEGSHELPFKSIKFLWNVNFALNDKTVPDLRVQTYTRPVLSSFPFSLNTRGNNTNRFYSELNDKTFGYNTSLTLPFTVGAFKQSLKVGGSATIRLRDFDAFIFGFKDPRDSNLLRLPFNEIFNRANINETNGFPLITDLQNPSDGYFGVSALSAGYLMLDNKFSDKLRLVWGARVENFEQFLKSNEQGTEKAKIVNTDKFDVLPSINLTISPNTKTNIRLAASKTVARPEFREIAKFSFFDFEQVASFAGNDTLKRTSINNADIRYEYYPKAGELLSFGVFYKNFKDPIELRLNSGSGPSRRQYEFQNAEKANLFGIEAEFRKSLSFLDAAEDSWLNKLYFNGNVSAIFSKVSLGNLDAAGNKLPATDRPLQGQSPYLINAGFQYDGTNGTNLSLLYNRIGERLSLVGNNDFGDIYEKPRNLLDFQISQKVIKKKGELKLTISDILNNEFATYENNDDAKTYKAGVDSYFTRYKPGTTITIGFNYNIGL